MNSNQRLRIGLVAALVLAAIWVLYPKLSAAWSGMDSGETVAVLVADRYIPALTAVRSPLVHSQDYPKALVPPGALHSKEELTNESDQTLYLSAIPIPQGQPITQAMLVGANQTDGLSSLVHPGKVAVSFEVDKAHGVGGWIKPGDSIAIFSPAPDPKLLLPSVTILAVNDLRLGQTSQKPAVEGDDPPAAEPASTDAKVVTVLLSPGDATTLIQARERGNLSLVLRSLGDDFSWPK